MHETDFAIGIEFKCGKALHPSTSRDGVASIVVDTKRSSVVSATA